MKAKHRKAIEDADLACTVAMVRMAKAIGEAIPAGTVVWFKPAAHQTLPHDAWDHDGWCRGHVIEPYTWSGSPQLKIQVGPGKHSMVWRRYDDVVISEDKPQ